MLSRSNVSLHRHRVHCDNDREEVANCRRLAPRCGQERNQIQPLRFDRLITSVCNATKDQLKAMPEFEY